MGVSEDSPLRDPDQIPFLIPTPSEQNPPTPIDEEEMTSMRELVEQIDAHVELDDMEATSVPCAGDQPSEGSLTPITDKQQIETASPDGSSIPNDFIARLILFHLHLFFLFLHILSYSFNLPMSPGCGDRTIIFFARRNFHMVIGFGDET